MTAVAGGELREPTSAQCWCCGMTAPSDSMVHLGNHPEVVICVRCAHSVATWAWEIEDRSRSEPLVTIRDQFRVLRKAVVRRGWHHNPVFGGPIRWIGKRLP